MGVLLHPILLVLHHVLLVLPHIALVLVLGPFVLSDGILYGLIAALQLSVSSLVCCTWDI